jgi:hypothetical protein
VALDADAEQEASSELPAEPRALLLLIYRYGRDYGYVADLLKLDPAEVRRLAHLAVDELLRDRLRRPSDRRRGAIVDHVLGEGSPADRERAQAILARSRRARAWAEALERSLRALAPVEFGAGSRRSELAPVANRLPALRTAAYIVIGAILVGVGLVLLLSSGGRR